LFGLAVLATFVVFELRSDHPLIDLRVFTNKAFSAAAGAVTIIFFSLFGSLFALTQYLQLVHGYSPLSAGLRALPFALAMGATAPLSAIAVKAAGRRAVITGGLLLMSGGLLALSTAGVHSTYPPLALFVAVMGAGMGLVMAPASDAIMSTVPADQAGAGSAVNDTVREVGGALGIAVVGSVVAAIYGHNLGGVLATHHAPAQVAREATGSIAAADGIAAHVGGPVGGELASAAHAAFTTAMGAGMRVAAGVALAGALACFFTLPRRSAEEPSTTVAAEEMSGIELVLCVEPAA
jgi:MFS family permease